MKEQVQTQLSTIRAASAAPLVIVYDDNHAQTACPAAGGDGHHALGVTATEKKGLIQGKKNLHGKDGAKLGEGA